jgi:hypothetical protein
MFKPRSWLATRRLKDSWVKRESVDSERFPSMTGNGPAGVGGTASLQYTRSWT